MVEIIKYLHNKDLAILRETWDTNPELDHIFYLYKEIDEMEIKEKYLGELKDIGINIIQIKDLLKEIEKQNKKLIENITMESEYDYLAYNLFGYLFFIKLALKEIRNIAFSKGLTKISYIIIKDEENIAYEFSQYLLNNWGYDKGLEEDILNIVKDKNRFIEYYKILKEKLNGTLDKIDVSDAYDKLREKLNE
jgi:HD-like signal output (HDOD) protein